MIKPVKQESHGPQFPYSACACQANVIAILEDCNSHATAVPGPTNLPYPADRPSLTKMCQPARTKPSGQSTFALPTEPQFLRIHSSTEFC